jgi:hypothetical protein
MQQKQYIVFVGSNPSTASPDASSFHPGTRSRRVVDEWISQTGYNIKPIFLNVSDTPTSGNQPFKVTDLHLSMLAIKLGQYADCAVVALGKLADEALKKCHIYHITLPHPSGRNRLLNDEKEVKRLVFRLHNWILVYNEDGDE